MHVETVLPELVLPTDNPRSLYSRRLHRKSRSSMVNSRRRTWKERFRCWCTTCKQKRVPPSSDDGERKPMLPKDEKTQQPSGHWPTGPQQKDRAFQPGHHQHNSGVVTDEKETENKPGNGERYCSIFSNAPLNQLYFDMMSQDGNKADSQFAKPNTTGARIVPGSNKNGMNALHFRNEHQFEPIDKEEQDHKTTPQNGSSLGTHGETNAPKGIEHSHSSQPPHPARPPIVNDHGRHAINGSISPTPSPPGEENQQDMKHFIDEVAGIGPNRAFWYNMPQVVRAGLVDGMDSTKKKLQEALFEVITSEASYYRSINLMIDYFYNAPAFQPGYPGGVLTQRQKHLLFSNIHHIRDTSAAFLTDLAACFRRDLMMTNLCEVVYWHSENRFQNYVTYIQNQIYQTRAFEELNSQPGFKEAVLIIQSQPELALLDINTFLIMPMQRVTRLRLLIATLLRYAPNRTRVYNSGLVALASLEKLISSCDHQKSVMEQKDRLVDLFSHLEYRLNAKSVGSDNRVLVKEGSLRLASVSRSIESVFRQRFLSMRRSKEVTATLFLFDDLLLVVKIRSNKRMMVEDSAALPQIEAKPARTPSGVTITSYIPVTEKTANATANQTTAGAKAPERSASYPSRQRTTSFVFSREEFEQFPFSFDLVINNSESDACSFYTFLCKTLSERERWVDALSPTHYGLPEEFLPTIFCCPQMIIRKSYSAQEGDELELKEGDQIRLLVTLSDGWSKGILLNGRRGWFPTNIGEEVVDASQIRENSENFFLMDAAWKAYTMRKLSVPFGTFVKVEDVQRNWLGDLRSNS